MSDDKHVIDLDHLDLDDPAVHAKVTAILIFGAPFCVFACALVAMCATAPAPWWLTTLTALYAALVLALYGRVSLAFRKATRKDRDS